MLQTLSSFEKYDICKVKTVDWYKECEDEGYNNKQMVETEHNGTADIGEFQPRVQRF